MGYKRVRTLGDASRYGLWLEVICRNCDRRREILPGALLRRFHAGVLLLNIEPRLRCRGVDLEGGGCGSRGAILRPIFQPTPEDDGAVTPFRRRA